MSSPQYPTLFDRHNPDPAPSAHAVVPVERVRLSAQCRAILARLQRGPATNHELAGLALKYTGRLSDLRAAGYTVTVQSRDYATGRVVYQLTR